MDLEIPVLSGYLSIPTQSSFSLNRISKKKPCHRYCLLYKSSRHGIERLEICESKEDKNPKIITLENCVKISQEPPPANLINIVKKTGTLTLNTLSDDDLKDWVNALQSVAFTDKNTIIGSDGAIEEDNDLYSSSAGDGFFKIKLIPSDTSRRCKMEAKEYLLFLTSSDLQLKSEDFSVVANWPYRFIRKYGYRDGKFTFEAGRKCSTGEGIFTFDHENPQEVFRVMSAKMKSMKKLISGEGVSGIDSGENTFCGAASMEAGSRSPLPPSPSNQYISDLEINSTQSCISLRGILQSTDSMNNGFLSSSLFNNQINSQLSAKPIPNKPPRKLVTPIEKIKSYPSSHLVLKEAGGQGDCDKIKSLQIFDSTYITSTDTNRISGSVVLTKPTLNEIFRNINTPPDLPTRNDSTKTLELERNYECIENITDAWKTLGVNDVKHTERISNDDFKSQKPALQREKGPLKELLAVIKTPKIIDIDIGESSNPLNTCVNEGSYDRLDFMSPNNKTSSGYKTIVTVSSTPLNNAPFLNDYELIEGPDIQSCRKADDTHAGYGVIRKTTITNTHNSTSKTLITKSQPPNSTLLNSDLPNNTVCSRRSASKSSGVSVDHRNYNGLDYTIVSKPKRV